MAELPAGPNAFAGVRSSLGRDEGGKRRGRVGEPPIRCRPCLKSALSTRAAARSDGRAS